MAQAHSFNRLLDDDVLLDELLLDAHRSSVLQRTRASRCEVLRGAARCREVLRQMRTLERLKPLIALDMIVASSLIGMSAAARDRPESQGPATG